MRGLGDLHMRSMLERMASQFKLEVTTKPPRIPYRETITAHGRRPSPPQEADRRRGPVRRGVPEDRAAAARRRLRVRRRGEGRRDPDAVHPRGGEGRRAGADDGPDRRLPVQDVRVIVYDGKYHRGRFEGSRVRHGGQARRSSTRSRRRGRSCSSRSSTSRSTARPTTWATSTGDLSSRRGQITGTEDAAGGRARRQGPGAARRARRLRRATEVDDRRAGRVHDGAVALRAGAAECCSSSSPPSTRSTGGTRRSRTSAIRESRNRFAIDDAICGR